MKVITSFFLALFLAAVALVGGYLIYQRSGSPRDTPGEPAALPSTQAGPVDPKRLIDVIPPLAYSSPPFPPPPPDAGDRAPAVDAQPVDVPVTTSAIVAEIPDISSEPRFIDAADLEAPVEVLERRIVNRAKEILDKMAVAAGPPGDIGSAEPSMERER